MVPCRGSAPATSPMWDGLGSVGFKKNTSPCAGVLTSFLFGARAQLSIQGT